MKSLLAWCLAPFPVFCTLYIKLFHVFCHQDKVLITEDDNVPVPFNFLPADIFIEIDSDQTFATSVLFFITASMPIFLSDEREFIIALSCYRYKHTGCNPQM